MSHRQLVEAVAVGLSDDEEGVGRVQRERLAAEPKRRSNRRDKRRSLKPKKKKGGKKNLTENAAR